jgi:hypothetical protein
LRSTLLVALTGYGADTDRQRTQEKPGSRHTWSSRCGSPTCTSCCAGCSAEKPHSLPDPPRSRARRRDRATFLDIIRHISARSCGRSERVPELMCACAHSESCLDLKNENRGLDS